MVSSWTVEGGGAFIQMVVGCNEVCATGKVGIARQSSCSCHTWWPPFHSYMGMHVTIVVVLERGHITIDTNCWIVESADHITKCFSNIFLIRHRLLANKKVTVDSLIWVALNTLMCNEFLDCVRHRLGFCFVLLFLLLNRFFDLFISVYSYCLSV